MSIGMRIKELRKQKKLTQVELSKLLSVTQAAISRYESDTQYPGSQFLMGLSSALFVNLNWLITGTGSMFNDVPAHVELDTNPVYSQSSQPSQPPQPLLCLPIIPDIAAGHAIDVTNAEPLATLRLPRSLLPLSPPYYCFRVSGISMIPTVHPADLVIVSGSYHDIDLDNCLCAFRTADGIILKRLALDHSTRSGFLLSDNPAIRPLHYTADTPDLTLVGIVIALFRSFIPHLSRIP